MRRERERLFVGTITTPADLRLVTDERWYRVPVTTIRERDRAEEWPPQWFAGWQTIGASGNEQKVAFYAPVLTVDQRSRKELFPDEKRPPRGRANKTYYRLGLGEIVTLDRPLTTVARRHAIFIHTDLGRLRDADSINDLWRTSPIEDGFWHALKSEGLPAERQWAENPPRGTRARPRIFDFALFCRQDNVGIEVDGWEHHSNPLRSLDDARKDTWAARLGWRIVRFDAERVRESIGDCLREVREVVDRAGGIATGEGKRPVLAPEELLKLSTPPPAKVVSPSRSGARRQRVYVAKGQLPLFSADVALAVPG